MKIFAALLLLLIMVLSTSPSTNAQQTGDPVYTEEFGVQMYSFRNVIPEIGLSKTLDFIQENGITLLEGGLPEGMHTEEFIDQIDSRGLSMPSIGANFAELRDNPEAVAERAKSLGAKYVMCAWINHEVGNFNFVNAGEAVEVFNKAGKVMAEHGLIFMYHFHGYELIPHKNGTLLDYIAENTHPDYVHFQMDVFWIHFGGGNPTHLLDKYGKRWVSLHLKDMKKGTLRDHTGLTPNENNVVIGTGEIDFEGILKKANELGITHMFLEDESANPLVQIPKSITYIKGLTY